MKRLADKLIDSLKHHAKVHGVTMSADQAAAIGNNLIYTFTADPRDIADGMLRTVGDDWTDKTPLQLARAFLHELVR